MIRLTEIERSDNNNQLYFTIRIDAKLAAIKTTSHKSEAERNINKKIAALASAVTSKQDVDPIIQDFKEYLSEYLFKHYVDIVAINEFLYNLKIMLRIFKDNIILAGYKVSFKYDNYLGEDEGKDDNNKGNTSI